jgi:hypothetical protein
MIQSTGRLRLLIFILPILFVWVGFDGYSQTSQSNESLEEVTPHLILYIAGFAILLSALGLIVLRFFNTRQKKSLKN